jgi:hypothetical protein
VQAKYLCIKIWAFLAPLALLVDTLPSQILHFPLSGKSSDDFSSTFGARNLTLNHANYPNNGYDYDFHCGIDIAGANGTNVYPVLNGTVYYVESTKGINNYVVITHTYNNHTWYVQYMHINPQLTGGSVTGGTTIIGQILDYSPYNDTKGDHVDIRMYYSEDDYKLALDAGAKNPGYLLYNTYGYDSKPIIVDRYDTQISDYGSVETEKDWETSYGNPSGRRYIDIGLKCNSYELDINTIIFKIQGRSITTGNDYTEGSLLYDGNLSWFSNQVDYNDRRNCGDRDDNNPNTNDNDNDSGHNSNSVGIYPSKLEGDDAYYTVHFRWYLNEEVWNDCQSGSVYALAMAWDWALNTSSAFYLSVPTCIGCGPSGTPYAPVLTSALYEQTSTSAGHVRLSWNSSQNGADFYKIYRCPSDQVITDDDVIGIAPNSQTGVCSYVDSDRRLMPGTSYRYAIAGVNAHGEGANSNGLTALFVGELPSSITSDIRLAGTWLCSNQLTIDEGATLTIEPGTTIKIGNGVDIVSNGIINARGTPSLPITFTAKNGTSPGSWGAIDLIGFGATSSQLSYCTIQYSYGVQCIDGADVRIDHCSISNSTYGVLCSASNPIISNSIIHNVSTHGVNVAYGSNPRIENNMITNSVISSGFGVYVYSADAYINCNTISGFYIGVYPRTYSNLGGWSGNPENGGYNYTPIPNNIIKGNTYGVDTWDHTYAFLGYIDGTIRGGYNVIDSNIVYDLVANNNTSLYAFGNWFGSDRTPTCAIAGYLIWWNLPGNPPGGSQLIAEPETGRDLVSSLAKKSTVIAPEATSTQAYSSDTDEDKLFQDAVSAHMNKSYANAQQKYKQLVSSKKYSPSALVLLSHLFRESADASVLTYFEDLKSNAKSHAMDMAHLPLVTNLLANMHGWRGNYVHALALCDEVIKKYPNTIEERNARVQKVYYTLEGVKDEPSAQQQLKELLSKYESGDDIEMITNFVNHSVSSPSDPSKPFSKEIKIGDISAEYSLYGNYPNPFNPMTTIAFRITRPGKVSLKVFDVLGREVATLVNSERTEGVYTEKFDASHVTSGIYFYQLLAPGVNETRKMLIAK